MTLSNNKQTQFELFPQSNATHAQLSETSRPLFRDFHLTAENSIVFFIIFVMICVLSFSVGVERGKQFSQPVKVQNIPLEKVEPTASAGVSIPGKPVMLTGQAVKNTGPVTVEQPKDQVIEIPLPATASDGSYTIQVASFKSEGSAKREADRLKKIGYEIYVLPKSGFSLVCVGKFGQKDEANRISTKLKNQYKDCLVRRM